MDTGAVAFWIVTGLVCLAVVWSDDRQRARVERTLHAAIERGVALDADTVRALKSGSASAFATQLIVAGVLLISVAMGVAAFAFIIRAEEPDTFSPLMAIAAFLALPSIASATTGIWLLKRSGDATRR